MSISCLIWKRHSSCIVPELNTSIIISILNAIPTNVKPFDIIQWLRHFIPGISQIHPQIMASLTDWSIDKTRSLQYSDLWPEIGLEFINNVFTIFSNTKYLFS